MSHVKISCQELIQKTDGEINMKNRLVSNDIIKTRNLSKKYCNMSQLTVY